jgi:hypothetical protein
MAQIQENFGRLGDFSYLYTKLSNENLERLVNFVKTLTYPEQKVIAVSIILYAIPVAQTSSRSVSLNVLEFIESRSMAETPRSLAITKRS